METIAVEYNLRVPVTCPFCKDRRIVLVNDEDYQRWQAGLFIQHAFPYLSDSEREGLMTGFCQRCWDTVFAEEEE